MPNDLERAFAALSDDTTRQARLAPAAAVRERADRQTLTRSLTGVALAAVLVAGVALGSRLVLADDALPPLPPAESTAPTVVPSTAPPSAAPSAAPSSTPSGSPSTPSSPPPDPTSKPPDPAVPRSIPARGFLTRSDADVMTLTRLEDARSGPSLCGEASYPSTQLIGVHGSVRLVFRPEGQGEDFTASGSVTDTITVFRSGGAEDFMDEFRATARDCPQGEFEGVDYTYRSLGSLGAGDESLLVRGATPARGDDGEPMDDGSQVYLYVAAVRVGDSVALVETSGFESVSAERADAERFTRKAAERLANWRN
jgi:hypothetical protein